MQHLSSARLSRLCPGLAPRPQLAGCAQVPLLSRPRVPSRSLPSVSRPSLHPPRFHLPLPPGPLRTQLGAPPSLKLCLPPPLQARLTSGFCVSCCRRTSQTMPFAREHTMGLCTVSPAWEVPQYIPSAKYLRNEPRIFVAYLTGCKMHAPNGHQNAYYFITPAS